MPGNSNAPPSRVDPYGCTNENTIKMILGDYGVQILVAINRGARTREVIPILSGVPAACVHGRLPVLVNMNLVKEVNDELHLTDKGREFFEKIQFAG
ncbi:MAG: hypothetical protein ACTSU5_20130 [Promethearchaeota archaeon]